MVNLYFTSESDLKHMGFKNHRELIDFVYSYGLSGDAFSSFENLISWVKITKKYDNKTHCEII